MNNLQANIQALINAIVENKPSGVKGKLIQKNGFGSYDGTKCSSWSTRIKKISYVYIF